MSKISKFKCNNCKSVFKRDKAIKKLEEVKSSLSNGPVYTEVLGCPECPSRSVKIEEMD